MMVNDYQAVDLDTIRAGILRMISEKLPLLTSGMSSQATIALIRPPISGRTIKEIDASFDAAIWSLIADGIIVPGTNSTVPNGTPDHGSTHCNLPYFRVTPFGISIATDKGVIDPHNRSEYLKDASERLPNADELILTYLAEANKNFLDHSYLSATVMLGVSAEGMMHWLMKALLRHVTDAQRESYNGTFERYRYRTNKLFEEFAKLLGVHLAEVGDDLRYQVEAYLEQLSTIIRVSRDDVAHGRAARVDRQLVYGNLIGYLSLLRIAGELAEALSNKSPCSLA
jgi:hypothetical protein